MNKQVMPCSVEFKNRILDSRKYFKTKNWDSSETLLLKIVEECESDEEYYGYFISWSRGLEGTVYLRDVLFPRFENSLIKMFSDEIIDNAWMGLDSVQRLFVSKEVCPNCGNARQVRVNQLTNKRTCHHAQCGNRVL